MRVTLLHLASHRQQQLTQGLSGDRLFGIASSVLVCSYLTDFFRHSHLQHCPMTHSARCSEETKGKLFPGSDSDCIASTACLPLPDFRAWASHYTLLQLNWAHGISFSLQICVPLLYRLQ